MCYLETHSCACTEASKKKIVHRRAIACPSDVNCLHRSHRGTNPNFWTSRHVRECADFHKGPAPVVPYRCPEERVDTTPGTANWSQAQQDSEILRYIDMDYVTFHDHLDKTAAADSGVFSESSFSTGDVDSDEYIDYRYRTGWMFNRLADGTLVRIPDGNQRGREEGFDHTPDDREPTAEEWDEVTEIFGHAENDIPDDGEETAAEPDADPETPVANAGMGRDSEVGVVQHDASEISNTRSGDTVHHH